MGQPEMGQPEVGGIAGMVVSGWSVQATAIAIGGNAGREAGTRGPSLSRLATSFGMGAPGAPAAKLMGTWAWA